ncbi:MAG: hypothetical protein ABII64_02565 [Elusimicrobiota bacterium]
MKKITTLLSLLFLIPAASFAVVDDDYNLIVYSTETYTLSTGSESYFNSIQIYGTLNVPAYNGSSGGTLELSAPEITIFSGGKIDVSGKGYSGGTSADESGEGPGGGLAPGGAGAYGGMSMGGNQYGSITQPDYMGSGGAGNYGQSGSGGAGGGKIVINTTGTLTNDGEIKTDGASGGYDGYFGGSGSGGGILINAGILEGSGIIEANGGSPVQSGPGTGGSGGRIAIYYGANNFTGTISAYGGGIGAYTTYRGGCGTIYTKNGSQSYGSLFFSNNNQLGNSTYISGQFDDINVRGLGVVKTSETLNADQLNVSNDGIYACEGTVNITNLDLSANSTMYCNSGQCAVTSGEINALGELYVNSAITFTDLHVSSGGLITHSVNDPDFNLMVTNNMDIDSGASINVDGKGYRGGDGVTFSAGEGPGGGGQDTGGNGGGGAYGGDGGFGSSGNKGITNDSMFAPLDFGSGGGVGAGLALGGAGGGIIRIKVDGTLTNEGTITSSGKQGSHSGANGGGGGAGGSIFIVTNQLLGAGIICADGGDADPYATSGAGSGGRIVIYRNTTSFTGTVRKYGGEGIGEINNGEDGTIYISSMSEISPVTFLNLSQTNTSNKSLSETVQEQELQLTNTECWNEAGNFGVATFSNAKKVDIITGAFANKGFFTSNLQIAIGISTHICHVKGMSYLGTGNSTGTIFINGYIDGQLLGTMKAIFMQSVSGGAYDIYTATLTIAQVQNQANTDTIWLSGNISVQNTNTYDNTTLTYTQANLSGAYFAHFSGNMSMTVNCVRINNASNPYNNQGFALASYTSSFGNGNVYTYAKQNSRIAMKGMISNPLDGYFSAVIELSKQTPSLFGSIIRLDYGRPVQECFEVDIIDAGPISPGQTIPYTITVRNEGSKKGEYLLLVIKLPPEMDFVSADGEYDHTFIGEDDWVAYPTIESCPERVQWEIPVIDPKTSLTFNLIAKAKWGLSSDYPVVIETYIYGYDPEE